MHGKAIILLIAGLWSVTALRAQERTTPIFMADSVAKIRLTAPPPMEFSTIWIKEATNPTLKQRREVQNLMWQRSRESVMNMPKPRIQDPNKNAGLWRVSVGNVSWEVWSSFPDRALDARNLRFPLPRNMSPDKRPLSVQRLEKLNK